MGNQIPLLTQDLEKHIYEMSVSKKEEDFLTSRELAFKVSLRKEKEAELKHNDI